MPRGKAAWRCSPQYILVIVASLWLLCSTFLIIRANTGFPTQPARPSPPRHVIDTTQRSTPRFAATNITGSFKLQQLWRRILKTKTPLPDSSYNFNVSQSERLPLDRAIPDTRPNACTSVVYDLGVLPKASVLIPFYNEAISVLLRTLHSILSRTPDDLLGEIILVDDASTHATLHELLAEYVDHLGPRIRMVRNWDRQGLIRTRLHGMELTTAPVVVFLDAHTEVNVGWLEPVLAHLARYPHHVVQPFIDRIVASSLAYTASTVLHRGSITWDLRYVWVRLEDHVVRSAREGHFFWTPTLVGCAIAVNKDNFLRIGAFDEEQLIWGGENVELSLRTWMCGGEVVTLPCSRVGHLYRPTPYKTETPYYATWQKNSIRTAEVWMDHYKKYFYRSTRVYPSRRVNLSDTEWQSLQKRIKLKETLQCKNFEWYLQNVAPDVAIPPVGALYHGEMMCKPSKACWMVLDDGYLAMTYSCYSHQVIPNNEFTFTENGLLLFKDQCVTLDYPTPFLRVVECPERPSLHTGEWKFILDKKSVMFGRVQLEREIGGESRIWCVTQVTSIVSPHKGTQMPQCVACRDDEPFQVWSPTYRFDFTG